MQTGGILERINKHHIHSPYWQQGHHGPPSVLLPSCEGWANQEMNVTKPQLVTLYLSGTGRQVWNSPTRSIVWQIDRHVLAFPPSPLPLSPPLPFTR